MLARERRPPRPEIDETALALLARHGSQILATARRYAASADDAEDAYQRGLEILLTKAPTTDEAELVPWLKTVVKHEAFALRRQRDRHSPVTDDGDLGDRGTTAAATHDQVERFERLRQGAEALHGLKPQEIRCLVLKAQGYSYQEICAATGFSYTKVNRCLTEGRQALSVRMAGIEGGIECARFAPVLSALADGEARPEDLALLRPHMKSCLSCRARLREFREAPARVAALLPPALPVAVDGGGGLRGAFDSALTGVQQKVEAAVGAAQHKAAALGERAHAAVELAAGQKLAAVAASAAALAGGGTAVDHFAGHGGAPPPIEERRVDAKRVKDAVPVPAAQQEPAGQAPATTPAPDPDPAPPSDPTPAPTPAPPPPDPANEFAPTGDSPPPTASTPPQPAPPQPSPSRAVAGGPAPPAGGAGAGEFGP